MKHLFSILLALLTALSLSGPARADAEPRGVGSVFYREHRDQCRTENRGYYANGRDGFVTLWDAPEGDTVIAQYENCEELWAYCTYQEWALVSCHYDRERLFGWAPMSELYLIYDHISFEEEYGAQLRDYGGEFMDYAGEPDEVFWFWDHPYAWYPKFCPEVTREMLDALLAEPGASAISRVYTDVDGSLWGYIEQLDGVRDLWLWLENPTCNGLMTSCIPEADVLVDEGRIIPPREPVMPKPKKVSHTPYIPAGAAAVAAAGVFCAWKRFRKTKK